MYVRTYTHIHKYTEELWDEINLTTAMMMMMVMRARCDAINVVKL